MQQLTLPGIEFAPVQARRHGLCEFHTYPLVSPGKDAAGVWRASFRVPAVQAWTFPELELGRPGNSIPALLFDLDGDPTDWLARVGEYMAAQRPSFCSLTLLTILNSIFPNLLKIQSLISTQRKLTGAAGLEKEEWKESDYSRYVLMKA